MTTLAPTIAIDTRTGAAHISSLGVLALEPYAPISGSTPPTFDEASDALLHWRWGRAIMPEATGVDPDAAGGFRLPISVVKEDLRLLAAGSNAWRLVVMRYPHALAGTGDGANSPVMQNLHNTVQHKGLDRLRFVTTTTPVGDARMETTIQRNNGGTNGADVTVHSSGPTRTTLGMSSGGMVFYFTEIIAEDASIGDSPNLRVTVWSIDSTGAEVLAPTQLTHFSATPSPNYPLWGPDDISEEFSRQYFGRAFGTTSNGTQGDIRAIVYGTRSGALLSDAADVKAAVDAMLRDAALPEPLAASVGSRHAWTSQTDRDFLSDVVGSLNLESVGSAINPIAAGSATMTGLADVWRGITIAAANGNGARAPDAFTDAVEADLAAGGAAVFLIALERASSITGVRSIVEVGSTSANLLCRVRQLSSNNLALAIVEGASTVVSLDCGALADLWPSQSGTLLICAQFTNNSADHAGETNKQQVIADVLHVPTLTRSRHVLYPDGSPAAAAMRTTTSNRMTVGVSDVVGSFFGGTIGLAYTSIAAGESGAVLWDQTRALDELWELFVEGRVRVEGARPSSGGISARGRGRGRGR